MMLFYPFPPLPSCRDWPFNFSPLLILLQSFSLCPYVLWFSRKKEDIFLDYFLRPFFKLVAPRAGGVSLLLWWLRLVSGFAGHCGCIADDDGISFNGYCNGLPGNT